MNLNQQLKILLRAGKSKSFIARFLALSKYRVDQLVEELVKTRTPQRQRASKLLAYKPFILSCLEQGSSVKSIYLQLRSMKQVVHYSTVARQVRQWKSMPPRVLYDLSPGQTALLSVIRIDRQKKDKRKQTYLFCLMMVYSQYCFIAPFKGLCLWSFLRMHVSAFQCLGGGVPCIHLCNLSGHRFTEAERDVYDRFLFYYGGRLFDSSEAAKNACREQTLQIKRDILSKLFHPGYKRLVHIIKQKYGPSLNLRLHPTRKKSIRKEFEGIERPRLVPLPAEPYPIPTVVHRKASGRGFVCYQYHRYKLPVNYKQKWVKVVVEKEHRRIVCGGQQIATYQIRAHKHSS